MAKLTRRTFLKKTAIMGAATLLGEHIFLGVADQKSGMVSAAEGFDLVSVKGKEPYESTIDAVAQLGGMKRFVSRGAKVGLLVNSPFNNFGASVNPDIVLAIIKMCNDAGAKEVLYLKDPHSGYWKRSRLSEMFAREIQHLTYESGDHREVAIKGGLALKDAKITKDLFACDVFINVPITKHHKGVHFTGALKNMMGLCPFSTNSYFHFGTFKPGWYSDVDHLSQCIADLNRVRTPDLCIADATAVITENGPYGPGHLKKPGKVVAALNPVSLDAYCCMLLGHTPRDILMIEKAARHKLGEPDLGRIRIKETTA